MNHPKDLEDLRTVREVVEYQSNTADFSVLINRARTNEVRVSYLKHLREEWEWVERMTNEREDAAFVLLKRREN